jgi:carboxylate-amine ligase
MQVPDCLLSAAHWRAAHDGLDDRLVDPRVGEPRPAWDVLDGLLEKIMPALAHRGELDIVMAELFHAAVSRQRHHQAACAAVRQRHPGDAGRVRRPRLGPWPSGG